MLGLTNAVEDSITGAFNAALGKWLHQQERLPKSLAMAQGQKNG